MVGVKESFLLEPARAARTPTYVIIQAPKIGLFWFIQVLFNQPVICTVLGPVK